ncbi:MAG: hypothetical protein ACTHMS_19955, partial [Jatrophihabitans sp.]|uniref:hypothetical protein n=1 Tax=Jatrophihabitans sp. TaxID=1932789 RepID=UPI003F81E452
PSGEEAGMQFSLFGAAAATPALADLDGVLLAGGHWVRGVAADGRPAARLSIVVGEPWRAAALVDAFTALGLGDGDAGIADTAVGVAARTAFAERLLPPSQRWTRGANEVPPADLVLTANGLRLWAIAAGRRDETGYLLGTPEADDPLHRTAGAQLARLGVAAVSIAARGGPGWRVTSVRRLRRLVELLGPAPAGGEAQWPV